MATKGERRRRKKCRARISCGDCAAPAARERPRDRRDVLRRLPPLQALREVGLIDRTEAEIGEQFGRLFRLASLHLRRVTAAYGEAGGHDVDESAQQAARQQVAAMLDRAGSARAIVINVAGLDERPSLTDVCRLRLALDRMAGA